MKRTTLSLAAIIFFLLNHALFGQNEVSKIYLLGSTLIRSTPGKGIKFYDIRDPRSPRMRGGINIAGNRDVTVSSDYMYADNGSDLVIYNIVNVSRPVAIDTIRSVFNQNYYNHNGISIRGGRNSESQMRISGFDAAVPLSSGVGSGASGGSGQAGSLARFAIDGNYLYCIDNTTIVIFDITDPWRPQYRNRIQVGWAIETLFPHKEKPFIGGNFGMYIYDIADPEMPTYVSQFTHVRSCDPVVVEGDRAYVTVRGNSRCGQSGNELYVLDITDLKNPRRLATVPLTGPYGLTVRDGIVVVCDGSGGLVTLDTRDPGNVKRIGGIKSITAHDVILSDELMVLTTDTGFYLYNAGNLASPRMYNQMVF